MVVEQSLPRATRVRCCRRRQHRSSHWGRWSRSPPIPHVAGLAGAVADIVAAVAIDAVAGFTLLVTVADQPILPRGHALIAVAEEARGAFLVVVAGLRADVAVAAVRGTGESHPGLAGSANAGAWRRERAAHALG